MNLLTDCITSLELFCGTKSFTKEVKRNGIEEAMTLDINPIFKPDYLTDIRDFKNPGLHFALIWASPPCQCFSLMSAKHYWKKENGKHIPKNEKTVEALTLIRKTIEIIENEQPTYWFIENPRGMLRFVIDDIMKEYSIGHYSRETVTYCQYGSRHMKPTDIWTNCRAWKPRKACKIGDSCHERVSSNDRGRKGTLGLPTAIHRAVVPKELCIEIIDDIKGDLIESSR